MKQSKILAHVASEYQPLLLAKKLASKGDIQSAWVALTYAIASVEGQKQIEKFVAKRLATKHIRR
jgi:hypothetical protein